MLLYLVIFGLPVEEVSRYLTTVFVEKRSQMGGEEVTVANVISDYQVHFFFGRMPFLSVLAFVSAVLILVRPSGFYTHLLWFERLGVVWLVFDILFFSLLGYRAVRYHLLLWPAMFLLGVGFLRQSRESTSLLAGFTNRFVQAGLFAIALGLCVLLLTATPPDPHPIPYYWPLVAVFVVGLFALRVFPLVAGLRHRARAPLLAGLMLFPVGFNVYQYDTFFAAARNATLIGASRDLPEIINADATFAGPYAHAFLYENQFPDLEAMSAVLPEDTPPAGEASHMILVPQLMAPEQRRDYTASRKYVPVAEYSYRGFPMVVLRNLQHATYRPTEFERGVSLFLANKHAESFGHFQAFYETHPRQLANLNYLGILHWVQGDSAAAAEFFAQILRYQPHSMVGRFNLALVLASAGAFAGADSLLASIRTKTPDSTLEALRTSIRAGSAPEFRGFLMNDLFIRDIRFSQTQSAATE